MIVSNSFFNKIPSKYPIILKFIVEKDTFHSMQQAERYENEMRSSR